ncbi:hypothetical protein NQ318_008972 [Aromia moschata]|uniref:Uncharacterized protein n=1 Tax=Aromia moschata TaxID=1265417 RepID=A0AAV8ZDA4_9CUCU|nr:hypothetical protein NQ318_008972 [Aromia moschata]
MMCVAHICVVEKVSYVVVGDDPGPAKLDKTRGLNIPEISEDDLLDMILVKSGMKPKFSKNKSEASSESGFATEEETSPKSKKGLSPESKEKHSKLGKGKLLAEEHDKHESIQKEKSPSKDKKNEKPNFKKLSDYSSAVSKKHKVEEEPKKEGVKEHTSPKSKGKSVILKSKDLPKIDRPKLEVSSAAMSWTEKYKPNDMKSIIGQQGEKK